MFDYKEKQIIYYKTNLQTREGTIASGSKKILFLLDNQNYIIEVLKYLLKYLYINITIIEDNIKLIA